MDVENQIVTKEEMQTETKLKEELELLLPKQRINYKEILISFVAVSLCLGFFIVFYFCYPCFSFFIGSDD
jgi:hypothetical protein